jgi:hypothetical protein
MLDSRISKERVLKKASASLSSILIFKAKNHYSFPHTTWSHNKAINLIKCKLINQKKEKKKTVLQDKLLAS